MMAELIFTSVKAILLVISIGCVWRALTPPQKSSPEERLPPSAIGRHAVPLSAFLKVAHALSCSHEVYQLVTPSMRPDPRLSPSFAIGWALTIVGPMLRFACYRELGRFFTFEMSIRKDHQLITTGPYAFVRHPAYTGLLMTIWGEAVVQFSTGSWFVEHGCSQHIMGKIYIIAVLTPVLLITYAAIMRGRSEDRVLREQFEKEWDTWADRTRYRLVPFVY